MARSYTRSRARHGSKLLILRSVRVLARDSLLQDQVFRTVHIWSSVFDLPAFVPSHPGQRFVCESYTKLIIENGHSLV
jgi:hypothetical protein